MTKRKPRPKSTVTLPRKAYEALEAHCDRTGQTKSHVVREALSRYIANSRKRELALDASKHFTF